MVFTNKYFYEKQNKTKQNKTKQIIFALSALLLSLNAFSHGETKTRTNCSWSLNEAYMYKAHARVNKIGVPSSDTDKACPDYGDSYAFAYKDNGCAWQQAINNGGSTSLDGSVYKTPSICARGFSNSELYYSLSNEKSNKIKKEEFEKSTISIGKIIFSEKTVTLPNINASFQIDGNDIFSSYEIIMWLPNIGLENKGEDTIVTAEKTFWRGKIELLNGKVTLSGNFPLDSYTIEKDKVEGGYKVVIKDLTITAELPKGINALTDMIEVYQISDAGVHENLKIDAALIETSVNNSVKFNVFPNPTPEKLNIQFNVDDLKNEEITVKLYDVNGKFKNLIFSGNLSSISNNTILFDLSEQNSLSEGEYYVLMQNGEESFIKRIRYQK